MAFSQLINRIKSAIFPDFSPNQKGEKRSRAGLLFALVVLIFVILLFLNRVFVGLDDFLDSLVFQFDYNSRKNSLHPIQNVLIVRKDEKTSHLIGRNPGRPEFASLIRFLSQQREGKFASKVQNRRRCFLEFKLGRCAVPFQGGFACTFLDWDNLFVRGGSKAKYKNPEDAPRVLPFVFAERFSTGVGEKNLWNTLDGPSAEEIMGLFSDYGSQAASVAAGLQTEVNLATKVMDQWQSFIVDFLRAAMEVDVSFFWTDDQHPEELALIRLAVTVDRKGRDSFTIPPAAVVAFDFLLDGVKSPSDDAILAEAIRVASCPIILAAALKEEELTINTNEGERDEQGGRRMAASTVIELRPTYPAAVFATGPYRIGFINVISGNKGYVSWIPVFLPLPDGSLAPSFSLVTAACALDRQGKSTASGSYVEAMDKELTRIAPLVRSGEYAGGFQMLDIHIPTDNRGLMLLNFLGTSIAPQPAPRFPAADFYQCFDNPLLEDISARIPTSKPDLDPKSVHMKTASFNGNYGNKICMVGPFELSDFDYFPTPFSAPTPYRAQSKMMMGIEIHTNAVLDIMNQAFVKPPDTFLTVALLIVATLLLGVILDSLAPVIGGLVALCLTVGVFFFAYRSFVVGQLFHFSPFLVSFPTTWALATLVHYFKQRSRARSTKALFGRFVSPDVVQFLTDNPGEVKPGGQKVELTIFFSDVAGFTTISEGLTPEGLVVLMNEYLGAMTELLFKHGGTLDKYIGDAVMAYWNFPKRQDDHALRACLFTIDMNAKIKELQTDWAKRGLPKVYARAGMNTAQVVVGCIGSQKAQMNFTCLGDGVNLASRLEGANKEYGTLYMVSDATYQKAKSCVRARFLDFLAVKGKKEPVKVHELVCEIGKEPPGLIEMHEQYMKGINLHLERKWEEAISAFEEVLIRWPDDGPTKTYIKRCYEYKENPPPENWDGSYHLTHK